MKIPTSKALLPAVGTRPRCRHVIQRCSASRDERVPAKGIIPPQRQYAAETLTERGNGVERRVAGQEPLVEIYADEAVQAASSHGGHRHSNAVAVRRNGVDSASASSSNPAAGHRAMGSVTAIDYDQLFSASGRARGPDALAAMAHLSDTNNIQVRMHGGLPAAANFPFESFSYTLRNGQRSTVEEASKASPCGHIKWYKILEHSNICMQMSQQGNF